MKKITLLIVFIITSLFSMSSNAQSNEKSITAIYKGMTVSDNFKFEDSKGNPIVFHDEDQSFKGSITLWDEGLIGERIKVSYKWVDVHLFNDQGIATGETMKVKRIFNYSKL